MNENSLVEIEKILLLQFQEKQQVFAKVASEEDRLRSCLAKLDTQEKDAEQSNQHHHKAIGADIEWNAWLNRKRTSLNIDLAKVLAQKERLLESVRKSYGKVLVSQQLLVKENIVSNKLRQKYVLEAAVEAHFHLKTGQHG